MKKFISKYKMYIITIFSIIFFTIVGLVFVLSNKSNKMDYLTFLDKLDKKEVIKAEYTKDADTLIIELKDGHKYEIENPQTEDFKEVLLTSGVDVSKQFQMDWEIALYFFIFIAMLVFFYVVFGKFYLQNSTSGSSGIKGKMYTIDNLPNITFQDVAGNEEAKENLKDIVQFLHNPVLFKKYGAKCPKGILLYGAPGIGKTLLAKAMAGEAKVPFISMSGSEFTEKFVGVGAARVRELFKLAREKAPCILFIDEIDAIGRKRGEDFSSNEEKDNTLNQLLVELDGFNGTENIVVIGATNRPDILDDAFRSGRFDRQVELLAPDRKAREAIIKVHLKDKPLAKDIDIERLGRLTIGMTGADIQNAVNEAAIIAAKNSTIVKIEGINNRPHGIEMVDLEAGINKVLVGDERKRNKTKSIDNEMEREIVAWHEAGHAIMGLLLKRLVTKATIVPTTKGMGGYTLITDKETDNGLKTKRDIESDIKVAFAGRAAEELRIKHLYPNLNIEKEITNGASNDILKATDRILMSINDYGMSNNYKNLSMKKLIESGIVKSTLLENEIQKISNDLYTEVINDMENNIVSLKNLANELLKKETLYEEEIVNIFNND